MTSKATKPVGIIGAGTMGVGIAQAAATAGWQVRLFDVEQSLVDQAMTNIGNRFSRLVEKGRISSQEAEENQKQIETTTSLEDLADCDLIIEVWSRLVGATRPEEVVFVRGEQRHPKHAKGEQNSIVFAHNPCKRICKGNVQ